MCQLGDNISFNGTVVSNPGTGPADGGILAPVRIVDGGGDNPDTIVTARADARTGIMPTIVSWVDSELISQRIFVHSNAALKNRALVLLAGRDGSKVCTLMQLSQDLVETMVPPDPPLSEGKFEVLRVADGDHLYNPADWSVFADMPAYAIGDVMTNLGSLVHQRYSVLCNQLTTVDPIVTAAPHSCTNTQPLVDQIVNVQARYGVAPANRLTVNEWVEPSGLWAANTLTAAQIGRILAVRVAVLARSPQMEKDEVQAICSGGTGSIALWAGGPAVSLSGDECRYRYKVFETVVPVRNAIWGCAQAGVPCTP